MKTIRMIFLLLIVLCSFGTAYAQPAEPWKTGQTTSYAAGDDGDWERGVAWPATRFTDNGNGTVKDNLTGLIWLKNANCAGYMTWNNALNFCNNLSSGSYGLTDGSVAGDWRLPNRKELLSLIDYSRYNPALPQGHPFTNVQSSWYWSATTYADYTYGAWIVSMFNGGVDYDNKTGNGSYVWPVRGGQSGSLGDLTISNVHPIAGRNKVYLEWDCEAPPEGSLYFTILCREASGDFHEVTTPDGAVAVFYEAHAVIEGLDADKTYFFKVVGHYQNKQVESGIVSAKPLNHSIPVKIQFNNPLLLIPGTGGKAWNEMNKNLEDLGLVHGGELNEAALWDDSSDFPADHVGDFYTCNYTDPCGPIANSNVDTECFVDKIREAYRNAGKGEPRVILAGQSLGGLRARAAIQKKQSLSPVKDKVERLITIGTPNRGVLEARSAYERSDIYGVWRIIMGNASEDALLPGSRGYINDPDRYYGDSINRKDRDKISLLMVGLRVFNNWDFTGKALKEDVLWDSPFMNDINCWEHGSCDNSQFTSLPAGMDYRYVVGIRPTGRIGKRALMSAEKLNYFMFKGGDGDGFISAESQSLNGLPNPPNERTREVILRPGQNHESELRDYTGLLDAVGLWSLKVVAKCPVDIAVESPSGLTQTKDHAEILGARYMEADVDGDGEIDKFIEIPFPEQGEYQVTVTPEEGADPNATYSLEITQGEETTVIKQDEPISQLNGEPEIVHVNAMPVADAGPDQSLVADISGSVTATLDGSNSSDAGSAEGTNDDIVGFEWFENDTLLATGEVVNVSLGVGGHEIKLVVTDHEGASGEDKVYVRVFSRGDLNRDGIVDKNDLNIINANLNKPASVCPECDIDANGTINILDARKLVLMCTCPKCVCP